MSYNAFAGFGLAVARRAFGLQMQTNDYTDSHAGSTASGVKTAPALTILYHPDLSRVGERAILTDLMNGRPVTLSRDTPAFAPPGRPPSRPLEDACISRTPIRFATSVGGGVSVQRAESRTRIEHRGEPIGLDLPLSRDAVTRGAVLRLGGLIVLLLHPVSLEPKAHDEAHGLAGESDGIARVRSEIERIAGLPVPALLRGETGSGKELVARAIHQRSERSQRSFVAVNLGAIAPELAAAELFGAERGSFTGSIKQHEGHFGAAHRGTLFLDEIGEAPAQLQAMLLRALESGEIQRVGASRPQRVDVRIIAATDADLEARIRDGTFRAPLYHRLAACQIWIPPLRERRDDIGRLLLHFLRAELASVGETFRLDPAEKPWLPPSLVARIAELSFPGNVRQLQNTVRQLVISGRGRDRIEMTPAIEALLIEPSANTPGRLSSAPPGPEAPERRKPSDVTDEELISTLRAHKWEIAPAAEALRISRASMYVLVERSHIRTAGDLTSDEIIRCYQEQKGDIGKMVDRLEVSEKALRRRVRELGLKEK